MTHYNPVTPALADELRSIVGAAYVIYDDPERMVDYGHDEVHGAEHAHLPEAVIKPGAAAEIAAIMRMASRERIPVTPRGAGSGLSGGAVPVFGGIVLSLERMNRILEIDLENLVAVVEPGVITNDLSEAVQKHGLFYAGYPMSTETCFIGGNVAENAGGGRAIKYGVTSRYVLGLEVVLPTGEIVELGGKRLKDVTGYNLLQLMIGSEGTLGIFTRIVLRLLPMPRERIVLLVPFADPRAAIAAVPKVIAEGRVIPAAVEFMDRFAIQAGYAFIGEKPPRADMAALLLFEVDGYREDDVTAQADAIVDLCLAAGALDVYLGNTPASAKKMWRPRQRLAEGLNTHWPTQTAEDLVVPPARIPELLPQLEQIAGRYDVHMPCFGHAGDGNLHVHILKKPEMSLATWQAQERQMLTDIYRVVVELGGTITGEHGIGSKRASYLSLVQAPSLIALEQRIKAAFDPLGILNPGKIFPGTGNE
jgi:glycolate oxidase